MWAPAIQDSGSIHPMMRDTGSASADDEDRARSWTFLTNHAHVLVWINTNPESRVRDIAASVGITERAAQSILRDLEIGGYVSKSRHGRRNVYTVHPELPFRHRIEADRAIGDLLLLFTD